METAHLKAEIASQVVNGKTVVATTTGTIISFIDPYVALVYITGFFSGVGVTVLVRVVHGYYARRKKAS